MLVKRITSLLIPLLALYMPRTPAQGRRAVSVREADAVCGSCHREIVENYLKTSMANASGLATDRTLPGSYTHPTSGVRYTVSKRDGDVLLRYSIPATPPIEGEERLEYFLGSGHLGLTYLYEKNGYWLESPVAFYAKLQAYTMKPGLETSREMPSALTLNPSCLRCHMSGVQEQVAGTENLYRTLPFQQVGVTCESCHGNTREHVLSKGRASVVNPTKLTPERRDSTCIVCHLEGDTHVERRGRSALEFKPGDDISDSLTYFVHTGQDSTRRAVSEIEQFSESRCKRATGASMSCMNCHDPHRSPTAAERVAFYRGRCLACHSAPAFASEHFPSTPDCTSCHMPKTGSENIAHVAWTDHRILRQPGAPVLMLSSPGERGDAAGDLVSVLGGSPGPRELGLAYYDLAVNGSSAARPRARQLLMAATEAKSPDALVLRSLGILAQMDGDAGRAEAYYRSALAADPANFVSGINLGTLLGVSGDLEDAAKLWGRIFEQNQDVPELGQNLAIVDCRLGRRELAQGVLATVLTYSPGLMRARNLLADIASGQQPCVAQPAATSAATR